MTTSNRIAKRRDIWKKDKEIYAMYQEYCNAWKNYKEELVDVEPFHWGWVKRRIVRADFARSNKGPILQDIIDELSQELRVKGYHNDKAKAFKVRVGDQNSYDRDRWLEYKGQKIPGFEYITEEYYARLKEKWTPAHMRYIVRINEQLREFKYRWRPQARFEVAVPKFYFDYEVLPLMVDQVVIPDSEFESKISKLRTELFDNPNNRRRLQKMFNWTWTKDDWDLEGLLRKHKDYNNYTNQEIKEALKEKYDD